MSLLEYLKKLNSSDTQNHIWVKPENPDDFIVAPLYWGYNTQSYGDRVSIGSLDSLSFGFQSYYKAFACWVSNGQDTEKIWPFTETVTDHRGKEIKVNPQALYEAWSEGRINPDFGEYIDEHVKAICEVWADVEAHHFITNVLPDILAEATKLGDSA